jgi:Mg2+ and Co2+ transporter CorA
MFDDKSVGNMAISSGELLHLMSASLHRTNFATIDREIKAISFQELRNPDMRTNAKLLALREVLSELATGTADTSKYAPSQVHIFYGSIYDREPHVLDGLDFHSPIARLAMLSQQADELQRFLMDSFQLLMSSISVKETQNAADQAKMSMEQAARTAKLTQLAFVYIPLTFVTSIFGMNVRELSDPVLPLWVCAVTLVVIAAATAAIFGSYKYKPVNLLSDMLRKRETKMRGLRRTATPSNGTDAIATDVEKGPARS